MATQSVTPSWLPAGVTLWIHRDVQPHVPPGATPSAVQPVSVNVYRLPGAINADTTIAIEFNPNATTLPSVGADPRFFDSRRVDVAGNSALITTPKSGRGPYRLDWMDADGYHSVLTERLQTRSGVSGYDIDVLIRIIRSLY